MRDGALLRGSATPATVRVAIPTMRDGPLFRGLATPELTVGRVVIPTLARFDYNLFAPESRAAFLSARQRMFAQGLYPGVDYLVEERSAGGGFELLYDENIELDAERAQRELRRDRRRGRCAMSAGRMAGR